MKIRRQKESDYKREREEEREIENKKTKIRGGGE